MNIILHFITAQVVCRGSFANALLLYPVWLYHIITMCNNDTDAIKNNT